MAVPLLEVKSITKSYAGVRALKNGSFELLEGEWDTRRIVIAEFPDMAAARGWYESEDYAPLKALRQSASTTNIILVEGA